MGVRDAELVRADAARSMPHTLRSIELDDETIAELEMIVGFDDDPAGEATRISNRLRGLLTQIHPHLERVLGPRIQHPAVLQMLDQFGSPALIRKAGQRRLISLIRPKAPRMAERLVEDIFTALDEQTVVVPGTDAAALIVPSLASSLQAVLDRENRGTAGGPPSFQGPDVHARHRRQDRSQDPHRRRRRQQFPVRGPPRRLRRTRSGDPQLGLVDPRRTALPPGKQAAQTGLLPVRVRGPPDPVSRAYYDKKIAQGKHHTQALLCLARR